MTYLKDLFLYHFPRVLIMIGITYFLAEGLYEILNKTRKWNDKKEHLFYRITSTYLLLLSACLLVEAFLIENMFFVVFSILLLYESKNLAEVVGFTEAINYIQKKVENKEF